jgi:hypothetical protein
VQPAFSPEIIFFWVRNAAYVIDDALIQLEQIQHLVDPDTRNTDLFRKCTRR